MASIVIAEGTAWRAFIRSTTDSLRTWRDEKCTTTCAALAHLVLNHPQPLAEAGATRRARPRAGTAGRRTAGADASRTTGRLWAEDGPKFGRPHQLDVGPFAVSCGRRRLTSARTSLFVYGANGTGKSSFCEALEVAMLFGSISEAQVKRVGPARLLATTLSPASPCCPILAARRLDEVQTVQPDEAEYRFCFIEKNRLDDFARIAARTLGDQRQLIATLFGVDQFSEFRARL